MGISHLVCVSPVRAPPLSPVMDGDHLVLGDRLVILHLEHEAQLLGGHHLVSLKTGDNLDLNLLSIGVKPWK